MPLRVVAFKKSEKNLYIIDVKLLSVFNARVTVTLLGFMRICSLPSFWYYSEK